MREHVRKAQIHWKELDEGIVYNGWIIIINKQAGKWERKKKIIKRDFQWLQENIDFFARLYVLLLHGSIWCTVYENQIRERKNWNSFLFDFYRKKLLLFIKPKLMNFHPWFFLFFTLLRYTRKLVGPSLCFASPTYISYFFLLSTRYGM